MLLRYVAVSLIILVTVLPFTMPAKVTTTHTTHVVKTQRQTRVRTQRKKTYVNGILTNTDENVSRSVTGGSTEMVHHSVEHGLEMPAQPSADYVVEPSGGQSSDEADQGSPAEPDNTSFGGHSAVRHRGCESNDDCPAAQYCKASRCRRLARKR
ncbi:hypothetical protein HDE_06002 [Halotydeus destructor]|nr:hypothetical protein HDE_06002 [Halotydeus destructor]